MSIKFELSIDALGFIGDTFKNKTEISLFSRLGVKVFDGGEKKKLIENGILDLDGNISKTHFDAFKTLAEAKQYTELLLQSNYIAQKTMIFTRDEESVMLTEKQESVIIQYPSPVDDVISLYTEVFGESEICPFELSAELNINEALVFTSLFDLTRKAAVLSAVGEGEIPDGFTFGQIEGMLKEPPNGIWVSDFITQLKNNPTIKRSELEAAIDSLMKKENIIKDGEYYTLTGMTAIAALNSLIVENILTITTGVAVDDGVISTQCWFLQSGIKDILFIGLEPEGILIQTVCAQDVINTAKEVMISSQKI